MQLTPSLVPSDPALLSTFFPGTGTGAPRAGAPVAEGRATVAGSFGELFPELGATTIATAPPTPTASRPIPTATLSSPATAWPSPVAPATVTTTPAPAPAPFAPESTPTAVLAAAGDQSVRLVERNVEDPAPHECIAERRSQVPSSRRLSEKHLETIPRVESPAAPEATRDERAMADAVVLVNLVLPVTPAPEPNAALPTAEWEPADAAPASAEQTPPVSSERPLPLFPRAAPSSEAGTPPVLAAASAARTREFPTIVPTHEMKPVSPPVPTVVSGVPLTPHRETLGTSPRENRTERMPVVRPAPEAGPDYVSRLPDAPVRSTPNQITPQSERAAFPQTLPEATLRQPELAAVAVRSMQPEPVALAVATTPAASADRGAHVDSVELIEELTARLLDGRPVEPSARRSSNAAAKFAPEAQRDGATPSAALAAGVKTFVDAAPESLTRHRPALGIGVAKSAATMSERLISALPPHPMPEYGMVAPALEGRFEPAVASAAAPAPESSPTQTVSSAQRAVEVALRAVDVAAVGEQKTVNLDFAVGDADLNVRIEIRAKEVHTTFRTDSAELRTALAQEWQAVTASPAADRGLRLAPATFASADATALNASGGDASSRERHAPAQPGENPHAAFTSPGRARIAASDRSVSAPTAIRALVAAATSRHLHTLA